MGRFVLVSSIGVDQVAGGTTPDGMDEVFLAYLRAKLAAEENLLARDGLDVTVLRPGGLTDEPGTGQVTLAPSVERGSVPARRRRGGARRPARHRAGRRRPGAGQRCDTGRGRRRGGASRVRRPATVRRSARGDRWSPRSGRPAPQSAARARGDAVVGIVRTADHEADLTADGVEPVVLDLENCSTSDIAAILVVADAVVFAAGAPPGSVRDRKDASTALERCASPTPPSRPTSGRSC